jgi:hypothetical protein
MNAINQFGEFEISPKKGYVSLRRKRQFAMLGPATNTRFELGINIKELEADEHLLEQPAGSMCNYKVRLTDPEQVDEPIVNWVRRACGWARSPWRPIKARLSQSKPAAGWEAL